MNEKSDLRFQMKQLVKQAVQNYVLPVCYRSGCRAEVDPRLVVFADAHHMERPAAMELLYRRLKREGTWKIVEHYLDYGSAGAAQVAKHSMRFMELYARAGFVVICDNFLPVASCRKREETKVIQLWHACGSYKKFGYDAKDDIPAGYRGANVYRNASLVTVSGEAAVAPFTSAMRLEDGIVQAMGVSRTDLYASKKWQEKCLDQFYRRYPEAEGKKVVLWAPTFRGNAGKPYRIPLDLDALKKALGPEYFVLVKLHPHMCKPDTDSIDSGRTHRDMNCTIPTEELYPVVDVLVADYSSLIYEYLLFGKRVVLYVPDLEQYRAERGFYMDISMIPGEIVEQEEALAGAVRRAALDSDISQEIDILSEAKVSSEIGMSKSGQESLADFMKRYMGACDGHATERIVEWMRLQNRGV